MTTHNPALIRFITGRYRDLQGLSTVADAGLLFLGAGAAYLGRSGWVASPWKFVLLAAYMAYVWARFTVIRRWIDAYYASRCGRVDWNLAFPFAFPLYLQGLLTAPLLIYFHVPAPVRVALVMVLLAGLPAWIAVRDWPYRAHWLLPLAAGVVLALGFATVTTPAQSFAWLSDAYFAGGVSLALAGLLDHTLLLKTLQAGPSGQAEGAPVQAP